MDAQQMEAEIAALKRKLNEVQGSQTAPMPLPATTGDPSVSEFVKYLMSQQYERTERINKVLAEVTQRIKMIEDRFKEANMAESAPQQMEEIPLCREVPLSSVDAKIINFVQTREKGMACADEVRDYMQYKGNNAACARLNRLYKAGLLDRLQLGHKVYYKYDAGKATNTLIVSPP